MMKRLTEENVVKHTLRTKITSMSNLKLKLIKYFKSLGYNDVEYVSEYFFRKKWYEKNGIDLKAYMKMYPHQVKLIH